MSREEQIYIRFLAEGFTNREIAEMMEITESVASKIRYGLVRSAVDYSM